MGALFGMGSVQTSVGLLVSGQIGAGGVVSPALVALVSPLSPIGTRTRGPLALWGLESPFAPSI